MTVLDELKEIVSGFIEVCKFRDGITPRNLLFKFFRIWNLLTTIAMAVLFVTLNVLSEALLEATTSYTENVDKFCCKYDGSDEAEKKRRDVEQAIWLSKHLIEET
ncbi:MAG TPA: hypothetical protein VFM18_17735 [Methanosarcina sp.]|nr:hypothetical protein [Methanosarcina sp.]